MAFAKATRLNQESRLRSVGIRSFKIYSDNVKVKDETDTAEFARKDIVPVRSKSVTVTKRVTSTISKDVKKNSEDIVKGKSMCRNSENTVIRRKALTDVSNLAGSSSRINLGCDGTDLMKSKNEKQATLKRISVGPRVKAMSISSGNSRVAREKPSQEFGSTRHAKSSQIGQEKNSKPASAANRTRTAKTSLVSTRKSFPFLKQKNLPERSSVKNTGVGSEEVKESSEGSRVDKRAIPRPSYARSYFRKNRASDGFILTKRASHSSVDVRPSQRKSIKIQTATKHTLRNSNLQIKSKSSKEISSKEEVLTSSKSIAAVSSSNLKNIAPEVPCEDSQGESSSNEIKTTITIDNPVRKNSTRRRSFTSSLMTGSKLLDGNHETVEHERLPNIDDECNQLEVAEYVDDIYLYYWVEEAHNPALGSYMSVQTEITPSLRGILVNWLIEVHSRFRLMQETLYLTVNLLDRYLSQVPIRQNQMQLIGLSALLLASKYEDFWHPKIKDLISISAESYTRDQILEMEKLMLKKIKFRLNVPTPYVFMLRFLKAAQSSKKLEHLAFYLIELSLVEYEALKFKPSLLCASAIYLARCTLHMTPAWTPLLVKHARYDTPEMRECAETILSFQKAAKSGNLKVTYEKYMKPELSTVAAMKPLESLPR